MIIVMGEVVVEATAVDQVRAALAEMETETRKEAGCICYAFSQDISDPTMVRISEQWESMSNIETHMASAHMAKFMEAMIAAAPSKVEIKAFEGTETKLPG